MHWTCACQQVYYPDNSYATHDAGWLISFVIRMLQQLTTTG